MLGMNEVLTYLSLKKIARRKSRSERSHFATGAEWRVASLRPASGQGSGLWSTIGVSKFGRASCASFLIQAQQKSTARTLRIVP